MSPPIVAPLPAPLPVPPAERVSVWPILAAWSLAVAQTTWQLSHSLPRWPVGPDLAMRGRGGFVVLAPEAAAYLTGGSLLFVFWLAKRLGGAWAGLWAAVLFAVVRTTAGAVNPPQAAAIFLLLAATWAVWRFTDDAAVGRGLVAGGCVGALPWFSRMGTVGAVVLIAWLVWCLRPRWRGWSVMLGAAVPLTWLALARGPQWMEAWAEFFRLAGSATRRVSASGGPAMADSRMVLWGTVAAVGALGVGALLRERRRRAEGILLSGLIVAMAIYLTLGPGLSGPAHAGIILLPFFVVGGAWLLARAGRQHSAAGRALAGVLVLLPLVLIGVNLASQRTRERAADFVGAEVRSFAEKNIAAGGTIIAPPTLARTLGAGGRWHLVDSRLVTGFSRSDSTGGDRSRGPAPEVRAQALADLRVQAAGEPVYWITRSSDAAQRSWGAQATVEVVGELASPGPVGRGFRPRGEPPPRPELGDVTAKLRVVKIVFASK